LTVPLVEGLVVGVLVASVVSSASASTVPLGSEASGVPVVVAEGVTESVADGRSGLGEVLAGVWVGAVAYATPSAPPVTTAAAPAEARITRIVRFI
jgi:hypothetical protein